MSKNLNSVFRNLPAPRVPRSVQNLSHSVTTSMNVGYLYPINWEEVLPGDTFNVKATQVSRLTSTFIKPVMDNLYLDIYHFYVPYTQIYDNAKDIFAVARPSQFVDNEYAVMPSTHGAVIPGSLGDYLGLPVNQTIINQDNFRVSLAPFRSFAHIYNHWFRNENVTDETYLQTGEFVDSEKINGDEWSPNNYTGMPPKVNKYKDYFTSALPSPQKGNPANVPITSDGETSAIVRTSSISLVEPSITAPLPASLRFNAPTMTGGNNYPLMMNTVSQGPLTIGNVVPAASTSSTPYVNGGIYPLNLYADLTNLSANLNDLRFAEAYQHELELNAMYGSRYNEYLLSHYGIHSDDLEIGIPQYLGGSRTPLNITQVAQTSNGNVDAEGMSDSPLGNVGAYSWSVGNSVFKKRFKYHGIVMTVGCLRYRHTYQQGVASKWFKLAKDDFYNPSFAYIGMQPIYTKELYYPSQSTVETVDSVFGYKPAWNEYRFSFNTISGEARSNITNSLDVWHFADNYAGVPSLSDTFVKENNSFFERTISVDSSSQDNFILNFYFDILAKRPITEFSEPSIAIRRW